MLLPMLLSTLRHGYHGARCHALPAELVVIYECYGQNPSDVVADPVLRFHVHRIYHHDEHHAEHGN